MVDASSPSGSDAIATAPVSALRDGCARYRKKPIVIEAIHCSRAHWAAGNDWKALPSWLADAYERGEVLFLNHPSRIEIKTLEGTMTADHDDMIIRGVKGELYPCKPDIFAATYEIESPTSARSAATEFDNEGASTQRDES